MKTVFSSASTVAHLWVHRRQPSARVGHNQKCFFEERDPHLLWSYGRHYCVGRLLDDKTVALPFLESSKTTNKVNNEVAGACRHLKVIRVEVPVQPAWANISATYRRVQRLLAEAARAKPDGNRPGLIGQAVRVVEDFNTFCAILGEHDQQIPVPTLTDEEIVSIKRARRAKLAEQRRRVAEREAAIREENAERLERWLRGDLVSLPYGCEMLLRRRGDYIETSHGARVSVLAAIRLWPLIQRAQAGTRDYEVGLSIDGYPLKKIARNGDVTIGCHLIPYAQLERMAAVLGLAEAVAA